MAKRQAENGAQALAEAPSKKGRDRITFHISPEVSERLRNAVYWSPGVTMADLAERGIVRELDKLERENGGPFDARRTELKGGRPMKK